MHLEIINSDVIVDNCTFINNQAKNGGAIKIDCSYLIPCHNAILNSKFINNSALNEGGAIKYTSYPPILSNNSFENNIGIYGPNIASYPVKVMKITGNKLDDFTSLTDVSSGEKLEYSIPLAVVDVSETISKKQLSFLFL